MIPRFKIRSACAAILFGVSLYMLPMMSCAQAQEAAVTDKDLEVAVRAFSFAYGIEKGDISVEIVYNPGNPDSSGEAKRLQDLIQTTGTFANRKVSAEMVPLASMGSTKSKIAYITHGMQKDYDTILATARNNKLLTFSTDFQCVENSKCVMGVTGENIIKIEISRSAAAASGVEFSQALRLMIGEVN